VEQSRLDATLAKDRPNHVAVPVEAGGSMDHLLDLARRERLEESSPFGGGQPCEQAA
jgi:hypothetical protein